MRADPIDTTARASRRDFLTQGTVAVGGLFLSPYATVTEQANEGQRYDVVIVGGGPAGLSAALVLGRACRRVLVVDSGSGRNAPAAAVHGFLSRDGTPPAELRRIGREQLTAYAVTFREGTVTAAKPETNGFSATINGSETVICRKLVLATGVRDELPAIPGLRERWGTGVFACPYCHGWEVRGKPWAFICPPQDAIEKVTLLRGWTQDLTYLTHGPSRLTAEQSAWLDSRKVRVREGAITGLEATGGILSGVVFEGGERMEMAAIFATTKFSQRSDLARQLGCKFVTEGWLAGTVKTDPSGATEVPGLHVVGDASYAGSPSVAGAVADGSMAAGTINHAMLKEDAG